MLLLYLLLVNLVIAQETNSGPNDIADTELNFELEDLGDYNNGPYYPWLGYQRKLSRTPEHQDSSSSSEEMSDKHARNVDSEGYPEDNLAVLEDYDDNDLGGPTRRMASPLELLGHLLSGKQKVLKGINEGVLGGKNMLDGIQEITKGLGEFLVSA